MPLDFLVDELRRLESRGLRRRLRPIEGSQRAIVDVDGRAAVNFSSNNYLGLASAPALLDAARRALDEAGFGAGASRLIVGNLAPHRRLEQALAGFHDTQAALLFNSGYQANVGVLSALAGPEDVLFSDELNHASVIDGCRLSRARVEVYRHRDVEDLGRRLERTSGRRRFIVTDTVFSMDGDLAPLGELRALADQHEAVLVIDEAHATGVVGPAGRGLAAAIGVRAEVHVGTLSKALGAFGAYVAGSVALIDYLANRARSFVFSTALPPSVAAAAAAALGLARSAEGDHLRERLSERAAQFARGLGLGPRAYDIPIFPIVLGDERATMAASDRLLAEGIYVQGIRPPTVPAGTSRLRFTIMATHTAEQIDHALAALARALPERGRPG